MHGIESPIVRAAQGKPSSGQLSVHVGFGSPGHIEINVEDDGAGLDMEKIRSKAVEQGLLNAEQAPTATPQMLVKCLFASGFSTSDKVTEDAGRGVGLDVIEKSMRKIGGKISLGSKPGRGSRFTLTVPDNSAQMVS